MRGHYQSKYPNISHNPFAPVKLMYLFYCRELLSVVYSLIFFGIGEV
jgi:hypothetical protein